METFKASISDIKSRLAEAVAEMRLLNIEPGIVNTDTDREKSKFITQKLTDKLLPYVMDNGMTSSDFNVTFSFPSSRNALSASTWRDIAQLEAERLYTDLVENRIEALSWLMFTNAVQSLPYENITANNHMMRIRTMIIGDEIPQVDDDGNEMKQFTVWRSIEAIANIKIDRDDIAYAIRTYKAFLDYAKFQVERPRKISGSTLVTKMRGVDEVSKAGIMEEFKNIELKNNWLTSRTWGFEIEVPDAKGVEPLANSGIEKGEDGSLRSYESQNDCECDCNDCVYHDCDCDYCDNGNTDPDHCGNSSCADCDSAEFRTTGGISRGIHYGMKALCEALTEENAEINDTAGVHIHVYAADLNMQQVAQVIASYAVIENVLSIIAGRRNVPYAREISGDMISQALRSNEPRLYGDKPVAVNVGHLSRERGTIEFRQMEGSIDWQHITKWAALVRGLVSACKNGAKFYDFRNITTLQGILDVYAKYDYTIGNESPSEHIYGSRTDRAALSRNNFQFA